MSQLKASCVQVKSCLFKNGAVEELSAPAADPKTKQRLAIQEQVFDNSDSIADNAKMISLLISVVRRMYEVMPEEQKSLLTADDRTMIEYTFGQFALTQTRADVQFTTEGLALVDKLLGRQAAIGTIIQS